MASNTESMDLFGYSVALSDDGTTLAVGAPAEDSSSNGVNSAPNELASSAGAVYVFGRNGVGAWSMRAYIKASNPGRDANFGFAVSLSADGNTLAVGAPWEKSSSKGVNSTPDQLYERAGAAGPRGVYKT